MERPDLAFAQLILPDAPWGDVAATPEAEAFQFGMAADYLEQVTGRKLDTMPEEFERMAQLAILLLVLQASSSVSSEQMEAVMAAGVLQSFSADGYAETYRAPGDVEKAQAASKMINPDPLINRLLWLIATPEKRAWWLAFWDPANAGVPAWGMAGFPLLPGQCAPACLPPSLEDCEPWGAWTDPFRAWTPGT